MIMSLRHEFFKQILICSLAVDLEWLFTEGAVPFLARGITYVLAFWESTPNQKTIKSTVLMD